MKWEIAILLFSVSFCTIIFAFRRLVNKKIKEEVEIFFEKAKIPKSLRSFIRIKINWE
tara:strand:+ start:1128 stop:1301 length:174 start_codon:yes stop_codon:yes gene_type:complete